jgi:tRNA isopentenyl-2-thiomethyl-A-37 hydroxylase MiaE
MLDLAMALMLRNNKTFTLVRKLTKFGKQQIQYNQLIQEVMKVRQLSALMVNTCFLHHV